MKAFPEGRTAALDNRPDDDEDELFVDDRDRVRGGNVNGIREGGMLDRTEGEQAGRRGYGGRDESRTRQAGREGWQASAKVSVSSPPPARRAVTGAPNQPDRSQARLTRRRNSLKRSTFHSGDIWTLQTQTGKVVTWRNHAPRRVIQLRGRVAGVV